LRRFQNHRTRVAVGLLLPPRADLEACVGSREFFLQASNRKISADGFGFGPASRVALTSALPGMQTRSHSSHETCAFSSFDPAVRVSARVSGTWSITSSL